MQMGCVSACLQYAVYLFMFMSIHVCLLLHLKNTILFLFTFYLLFYTELSVLRRLLASSCDEMVSGNAALCLAHLLELEGIASRLLGTDTVRLLLRHAAGDAKRTAVRQNAAIALGKLCRFEPRCPLTSFYKPHAADYILETSLKEH